MDKRFPVVYLNLVDTENKQLGDGAPWSSFVQDEFMITPDLMDSTFSLPALSATVVIHSTRLLFGGLCILNLAIILFISGKMDLLTWWVSSLPRLSNKIHSIFVSHFFNAYDVLILFCAAFASFFYQSGHWGLMMFGLARFVKRKVLLYTPSLLLLVLNVLTIRGVELTLLRAREVTFYLELTTPAFPIKEVFEQRTNEVTVMLP
ncbi:hypothetical protein Nepgr_008784 [Nepenthes gracilis]|uniref:dolichyl-P-Man:Man5GlcNAc2-PP-dolichol alpha-1,3-mannosyltransferase n=1 Tax=Nepenthes gracilis TaxID=150966 RepID=A0AAD3XJL7_NEPGR|nr:hypothetical protein Nepgr_008784 [Nepenthes gracilis]